MDKRHGIFYVHIFSSFSFDRKQQSPFGTVRFARMVINRVINESINLRVAGIKKLRCVNAIKSPIYIQS